MKNILYGDKDSDLIKSQQQLGTVTKVGTIFRIHAELRNHLVKADDKTLHSLNLTPELRDNFTRRSLALFETSVGPMIFDQTATEKDPENIYLGYDPSTWKDVHNVPVMAKVMSHEAGHFFVRNSKDISNIILRSLLLPDAEDEYGLIKHYTGKLLSSSMPLAVSSPLACAAFAVASAVTAVATTLVSKAASRQIEHRCDDYANRFMPETSTKSVWRNLRIQDREQSMVKRLFCTHPLLTDRAEISARNCEKYYQHNNENNIPIFMW